MQGTILGGDAGNHTRWGCREPYVSGDAGNRMSVGLQGTVHRWGCRELYVGGDAGNHT